MECFNRHPNLLKILLILAVKYQIQITYFSTKISIKVIKKISKTDSYFYPRHQITANVIMNEGYLTNQDLIVEGPNKMSSTTFTSGHTWYSVEEILVTQRKRRLRAGAPSHVSAFVQLQPAMVASTPSSPLLNPPFFIVRVSVCSSHLQTSTKK